MDKPPQRRRIRVRGTVQGVGFRRFVYGLANSGGLTGFVLNDPAGVLIEVEGPPPSIPEFIQRISTEAPAMSVIGSIEEETIPLRGSISFEIRTSTAEGAVEAYVAADAATCDECLAEIGDPSARRYRYPFTNCTNCGPRFTIVRAVPLRPSKHNDV